MTEKMTNVVALGMAIDLAEGNDELVAKLTKIRDGFAKKAGAEKKPTANQIANKGFADAIVEYLANGEKHTISEMLKLVPALAEDETMTNQRVSAIVRGLIANGIVVREEIKRKAYFSLA